MSGLTGITPLSEANLTGKKVFLRLDLNVPVRDGKIMDETRIRAVIPTIKRVLEHKCKLIISSHMGRPKTPEDRKKLSLEPVASRIAELLDIEVQLVEEPDSDTPKGLMAGLDQKHVLMLENLRFAEGETKNSSELATLWSSYTDVYINDAFGASHRAHASIDALAKLTKERFVGPLIQLEIENLDKLLSSNQSPFVAVLGGAKVSDKIGVIKNLMDKVDVFIIGGAMAYTFLKAQGITTGKSLVEANQLSYARDLLGGLEARGKSVLLPKDHVVAEKFEAGARSRVTDSSAIDDGWMGMDIGPQTRALFGTAIANAKTVFWNGPMGVFEMEPFHEGTFAVAKAVAANEGFSIVGGGDSAAAINKSGFAEKVSHISTGGGASLEYLQGDKLPGIEALRREGSTQ